MLEVGAGFEVSLLAMAEKAAQAAGCPSQAGFRAEDFYD